MASSPIPEGGPFQAPQGVHLLLSVGISALFWNLAVFWILGTPPAWPGAPFGLLYSLVLALWAPWRMRTHQGPLLKFWMWVVSTLLLYGGLALVAGAPWPQTFWIEGELLFWFVPGFLQGQLAALWAGQLASRARLYQLIEGIPQGKALEDRVRDFQLDADFSRANEAALSGSLVVLSLFTVALASISPYGRGTLSVALAVGFVLLCLLVGVLLRTYRREMEALMYGRRFSIAEKLAPLGWSSLLAGLAALGAWGLVLWGGPWVDWNLLFLGRHDPVPLPPLPTADLPPPEGMGGAGDPRLAVLLAILQIIFRFRNLIFVSEFIFETAFWLLPWAAAAFVLWPLVQWLLSGGRETKGLGERWWNLLVAQWQAFLEVLAGWWRRPRSTVEGALAEVSNAREWIQSLFRRPGPGRVPYPEVVEAFLSLVHWAKPLTSYRQGETTREFLDRLATELPAHGGQLVRVRDLLDQELFGPRGLDAAGRRAFLAEVAALVRVPLSEPVAPGVS